MSIAVGLALHTATQNSISHFNYVATHSALSDIVGALIIIFCIFVVCALIGLLLEKL